MGDPASPACPRGVGQALIVGTLLTVALALVVGVPVILFVITAGLTVWLFQWAITLAIIGYLLGIPYAIAFRLVKGRWPRY